MGRGNHGVDRGPTPCAAPHPPAHNAAKCPPPLSSRTPLPTSHVLPPLLLATTAISKPVPLRFLPAILPQRLERIIPEPTRILRARPHRQHRIMIRHLPLRRRRGHRRFRRHVEARLALTREARPALARGGAGASPWLGVGGDGLVP